MSPLLSHLCPSGCGSASSPACRPHPACNLPRPLSPSFHPHPPSTYSTPVSPDASFLFRPNSGSVAGCSVGLGKPPPYLLNSPPKSRRQSKKTKQTLVRASHLLQSHPSFTLPTSVTHNAHLHAHCQRILVGVASVAEAEYAAALAVDKCWLSSRSP